MFILSERQKIRTATTITQSTKLGFKKIHKGKFLFQVISIPTVSDT